jgi:multidrug efflux pump subunit AcrA (membrane-fusion protein)
MGHLVFAPEALIQKHGSHAMTWVVERGTNVARERTVELGTSRTNGWVSVVSGLNAGDQLIADSPKVSEGKKVRVVGEAEAPSAQEMSDAKGGGHGVH